MLQAGAALLTAVSLPSCNGIFEGIYDEPSVIDEFGFTKVEQATSSGTIYIDATSYTRWNYLDFETFALDTTFIAEDGSETGDVTEGWDFAVHRYDVKTNGGRVIETSFTSIDALLASGSMPQGTWVEDIWTEDRVTIDMSRMMDGIIVYAPSWYNQMAQCRYLHHASRIHDVRQSLCPDNSGGQSGGHPAYQLHERQ